MNKKKESVEIFSPPPRFFLSLLYFESLFSRVLSPWAFSPVLFSHLLTLYMKSEAKVLACIHILDESLNKVSMQGLHGTVYCIEILDRVSRYIRVHSMLHGTV